VPKQALVEMALRLGDNALIFGQRLTAWISRAPTLELDIALANYALDLIGQARLWLDYAGPHRGRGARRGRAGDGAAGA
jgi:ring-1,2-phenylacetyl-CoA epoxidase subunit PaaC